MDSAAYCEILCEGSYEDTYYLADIDGNGTDEIAAQHLTSISGGAGSYETSIYELTDEGLSEGYVHTVENLSTGFYLLYPQRPGQ